MSETKVKRTKMLAQVGMHSLLVCEHPDCNECFDIELADGVPFCPEHFPDPEARE